MPVAAGLVGIGIGGRFGRWSGLVLPCLVDLLETSWAWRDALAGWRYGGFLDQSI